MDYLPLFHNLRGRPCLLVGGGQIALRKLRLLVDAGAVVTVLAPDICQDIQQLSKNANIQLLKSEYAAKHLSNKVLVIAATNDASTNAGVSEDARRQNVPVNVVDDPAHSTVIFPSIVDRSPIQIAISSGGHAPVLARLLRSKLEGELPHGLGALGNLAMRYRQAVKDKLSSGTARKAFWERVFNGPVAEQVYANNLEEAERMLDSHLQAAEPAINGEVYLVGGGPGDPDLLTFKALRLMQQADIVLYDRLVSQEVLSLVRRDATLIYVGKTAGDHPVTQENINQKLVDFAKQGLRVLRLKGGDPFIFGRGGEEIEKLAENQVPFQVVPGITAASGCASYAGIPLTHRDYAQSVRFITGHLRSGILDLNWSELVQPNQTLVFYMGLTGLETICQKLIQHGLAATMPAALIEKGTSVNQRVFVADLKTLPDEVRKHQARAPTLIIVGQVVRLREKLAWFKVPVTDANKEAG